MKSRCVGLSWGEAAAGVLDAAASKAAGSMDCWYIGYNKDMAKDLFVTVRTGLKALTKCVMT